MTLGGYEEVSLNMNVRALERAHHRLSLLQFRVGCYWKFSES